MNEFIYGYRNNSLITVANQEYYVHVELAERSVWQLLFHLLYISPIYVYLQLEMTADDHSVSLTQPSWLSAAQ